MARPRKEPPSPSSIVPAVVRHARAAGLDAGLLLARFGLPDDTERRDDVPVAPGDPEALLEWVARALGEPNLGLRLGAALPSQRYGFAELAARASPTLGQALALLGRYAPLLHAGLAAALEDDGDAGEASAAGEARFVLRTPGRPRGLGRHVHELALAHGLAQGRAGSSAASTTLRAWFAHARPRDIEPVHAFFGTRALDFGCPDSGFALPRTALDAPMLGVDDRMVATAVPLADAALRERTGAASPASLAARVAAHLATTLPGGTDASDAACALRMSVRTLQRRLEDEGTTFTAVLDQARLDVARAALRDPEVPLIEVAFRLGFADLAAFSRAFKRWTGKPPGQWRRG